MLQSDLAVRTEAFRPGFKLVARSVLADADRPGIWLVALRVHGLHETKGWRKTFERHVVRVRALTADLAVRYVLYAAAIEEGGRKIRSMVPKDTGVIWNV